MENRSLVLCQRVLLVLSLLTLFMPVATRVSSAQTRQNGPCDIYGSTANGPATPCVAAFSTTRALSASYSGALYQVTRQSDSSTIDVGLLSNGVANAASQDAFCAGTSCTITKLYDQTSSHNDLTPAPPGGQGGGPGPNGYDLPAVANALPLSLGNQNVYGIDISPGIGYRNDATTNIPVHGQPEGVYMVTSTSKVTGGCCFDFGNAETSNVDDRAGTLDAINFICNGDPCTYDVNLDLEDGLYGLLGVPAGASYVTAMGWNDGQHNYNLYSGNAQSGNLTSTGSMTLPSGYSPMRQEGGIVLGIGGDNSHSAFGYFFEGVMTSGTPSDAAMNSVQANIVAAGYGGGSLSLNATAYASSQYSSSYSPAMADDGSVTTGWSPLGTNQDPQSFWEVDLGSAHVLTDVDLVTRQDVDQPETRRNFQLWASNTADFSLGHVVLGTVGSTSLPYQSTWKQAITDTTAYRYIAFVKTTSEYFFISEVRVFGH